MEQHTTIPDMVRFLVNVVHPTNEVLGGGFVPRWQVIHWLISMAMAPTVRANARLALFYDWLFYDPVKDNIMNIEPAALLLYNLIKTNVLYGSSYLDFLCRTTTTYFPPMAEECAQCVSASFRSLLEKRVVPSWDVISSNPQMDRTLRAAVVEHLRDLLPPPVSTSDFRLMNLNMVNHSRSTIL